MVSAIQQDVYPSRLGGQPSFRERVDPVVYEGGPVRGRLGGEDLDSFEARGFLFVESLLSPAEVRDLNQELRLLTAGEKLRRREEVVIEPGSDAVRSIFAVHRLSRAFGWLARDARLLDIARQILGSEVYLHQSRANLKPGFRGREFYWHSDFETWHVEDGMPRMRALSASVALTENYAVNGPVMVIPGSHKTYVSCAGSTPEDHYKQSLKKQELGVPDTASLELLVARGGIVAPTGPAGSVLFFDCNAMHGSNSNITPFPRSNAFFVYNSVENRLESPYCGLAPRPEHIAARRDQTALTPLHRG